MKDFIRQKLYEAIKSKHWNADSYPNRIEDSTFNELPIEYKNEVDKRIKFIEGLEFSEAKPQKLGVWLYKAPNIIKHPPFEARDKGYLLLAIINNNNMTTLYWKHKREGEYDFDITFEDLVEFSKSEFYDAQTKPVSIESIKKWINSKRSNQGSGREKFKKIKLNNGSEIKYFTDSNRFESMDGKELNLDDIFDELPNDVQEKIMQLLETKKDRDLVFEFLDNMIDEDYPTSFNMNEFKSLKSFNARIKYCEENLQRISSGSSRIVYKIDNEKVLKLAKNKKGLAQNEVEYDSGNDYYLDDIVAKVFDADENYLWIEMELAKRLKISDFKKITGIDWVTFTKAAHNYGIDTGARKGFKYTIPKEINDELWENEFTSNIFDYIGNYDVVIGDLIKPSTYGVVKRDGEDKIVVIDYGLTHSVYDSYYS